MENNKFITHTASRFIQINGDDKITFLQGIITNDIEKCQSKNSIYSCLLTPQGKFLADFFISLIDDFFLIEIDSKYFENFFNKLQIYKLRSNIDIKENSNLKSVTYFSNKTPKLNDMFYMFKDPRNINLGYKIYFNKNYNEFNKINELNFKNYQEILIKNLVPNSTEALIINKSLLLENNFENINAIDWKKGCYVGQEITARMKYRGLLKKKLYNLEIIAGEVKVGDYIFIKGVNSGEVISKANKFILCMMKIDLIKKEYQSRSELKIDNSNIFKFL